MKSLDDNLLVAGQLQTSDFHIAVERGVKAIINNRPDGEEAAQLDSHFARALAEQLGMAYHYLPMHNGQPLPENLVEDFAKLLRDTDGLVLAHCRSGTRTSFIWALGKVGAGEIGVDDAIAAAHAAGIDISKARRILEQAAPD